MIYSDYTFELINHEKWIEVINDFSELKKDIYFSPEYYKLFELNGDGGVKCIYFKQGNKKALYPFLINSVNDLGYELKDSFYDIQGAYGYNGVISNSDDPEFIISFYKKFDKYCLENNIIAEFTRFHPILENYKFSEKHSHVIYDRETVMLDLRKKHEDIWKDEYSSKNRNMIRKAEKNGFKCDVIFKPNKKNIDQFIDIYTTNMIAVKADSFYFFSDSFFYNTFDLLKEYVYLFNIRNLDGQLLSSSIVFKYEGFVHYHLSGRSIDADNSVNNYLIDQMVKFGQKNNASNLHLGGGRSNDPNDSLLKFKLNFSKTTKQFHIGKKVHNKDIYNEVIRQWDAKVPNKIEKYKNIILRYRYLK